MYILTIGTDKYTGNFEREMCAYMTGQIGDCEVGKDQADFAEVEVPELYFRMEDIICQLPDGSGCYRPVKCIGTTLEIYFEEQPSYNDLMLLIDRANSFSEDIKILSRKLEKQIVSRELVSYLYPLKIGGDSNVENRS